MELRPAVNERGPVSKKIKNHALNQVGNLSKEWGDNFRFRSWLALWSAWHGWPDLPD